MRKKRRERKLWNPRERFSLKSNLVMFVLFSFGRDWTRRRMSHIYSGNSHSTPTRLQLKHSSFLSALPNLISTWSLIFWTTTGTNKKLAFIAFESMVLWIPTKLQSDVISKDSPVKTNIIDNKCLLTSVSVTTLSLSSLFNPKPFFTSHWLSTLYHLLSSRERKIHFHAFIVIR